MPPRRSLARASSATPARDASPSKRSTRGASALPTENSARKRTARGASQQPTQSNFTVNNPGLPEVQTQQSYAYGSTTVPKLPEQLFARENMSLKQIAQTIDLGVEEAENNLQTHINDTTAALPAVARDERARRRASSREGSHDDAPESDTLEIRKTVRTAAWADSLDSDQLENIEEEESQVEEDESDVASRHDTEPSSFPSINLDHSYAYEKGLRRPKPLSSTSPPTSFLSSITHKTRDQLAVANHKLDKACQSLATRVRHTWASTRSAMRHHSPALSFSNISKFVLGITLPAIAGVLFCYLYSSYLCDPLSSSSVSLALQKYCGACQAKPYLPIRGGDAEPEMLNRLITVVQNVGDRVRKLETQITSQVDGKYGGELKSLKLQHAELDRMIENLRTEMNSRLQSSNPPSSPVNKINFFAPGNGALVDPRQTSPTRQRPLPLPQRVLMRMLGVAQYQSRPPITALESWRDVGDCWCSSDVSGSEQEYVRLGVVLPQVIYPVELVIEHLPAAESLRPDAAPRQIELWADFGHLDSQEWLALDITRLQGDGAPLGPTWARIGQATYDNTAVNHEQAFQLDININTDRPQYYSKDFVVRVISNHGAEHTCLYRVKLHGLPFDLPTEADAVD